MQIEIIKAGVFATVQDAGRYHYRDQGVPVSGAMDPYSARMANMVVGNSGNSAVIEFTFAGAAFKTLTDVLIGYAGGGAVYKIQDHFIPPGRPVFIPANQIVSLIPYSAGYRSYLAIAGGWDVPTVLKSKSTYVPAAIGGYKGRILQAGDILESDRSCSPLSQSIFLSLRSSTINQADWYLRTDEFLPVPGQVVRIIKGREFDWFGTKEVNSFFSGTFKVSMQSDRMGYRLEGPKILPGNNAELLSTAVFPGCIQAPHGGGIIMLMADCQTTGGYPRIAQVALVDLPVCGQLRPGSTIQFQELSAIDAERLYIEKHNDLNQIAESIKRKYNGNG